MSYLSRNTVFTLLFLFSGFNHAAETSYNNGGDELEIVCDKDNQSWIKELRFHNGIDTIRAAFFERSPIICRNGDFMENDKAASRNVLLDKYSVLLSK